MSIMNFPRRNALKTTIEHFAKVCWKHTRFTQDEEGSFLLEYAVSASILLTVVLGITSVCRAVYASSFVADVSRAATRYAMVRGLSLGSDCTAQGDAICIAQTGDITSYVKERVIPGIDPDNVTVTTNWLNTNGSSCGIADDCKAPGNMVRVTVTYPFPLHVPFIPSQTLSLSGSSQMVIVQ